MDVKWDLTQLCIFRSLIADLNNTSVFMSKIDYAERNKPRGLFLMYFRTLLAFTVNTNDVFTGIVISQRF